MNMEINNEKRDKVWLKRTIPVAWTFMKRRTKYYIQVFEACIDEAQNFGYKIYPKNCL